MKKNTPYQPPKNLVDQKNLPPPKIPLSHHLHVKIVARHLLKKRNLKTTKKEKTVAVKSLKSKKEKMEGNIFVMVVVPHLHVRVTWQDTNLRAALFLDKMNR